MSLNFVSSFFVLTAMRVLFHRTLGGENLWYMQYYATISYYGITILYNVGYDFIQPLQCAIRDVPEIEPYYVIQLGFYASSLFFLVAFEKRKKDHLIMLVHHFVTLFLVTLSYYMNFKTVGFSVLLLHDASDIFLYLSKFLHQMSKENVLFNFPTQVAFAVFVVVFAMTRLYFFPVHIIWSCYQKLDQYGQQGVASLIGLIALFCMHCYWFVLIVRMISRLSSKNPSEVTEVREK